MPRSGFLVAAVLFPALAAPAAATTVDFDGVDASSGEVAGSALDLYLAPLGVQVTSATGGTHVAVVAQQNIYGGAAMVAPSPPNIVTQAGSNDPVSYTLTFCSEQASVSFTRAKLLAGPNGITHPQWSAHALDANGVELAATGEGLIASFSDVPAQTFTLQGPGIKRLRVDSDNMHFAAFSAVLLDDLVLPDGGSCPVPQAALQITLDPAPPDGVYVISDAPAMPTVSARAKVVNLSPDPTATTTFTWTVSLSVDRPACGNSVSFDQDIQQSTTTVGDALYTMQFVDPAAFRGGKLKLTVKANVPGHGELTASTPDGLAIHGRNPSRATIQAFVDQLVDKAGGGRLHGLDRGDVKDALKRMACKESDQLQFRGTPGAVGQAVIGNTCPAGIGIFQITNTDGCPHPFTDCRNEIFNWRANVQAGVTALLDDVSHADVFPAQLRHSTEYENFIDQIVNPTRRQHGLTPIRASLRPAPNFPTAGLLGALTNRLLMDAVRGYNGYNVPLTFDRLQQGSGATILRDGKTNALQLHEFVPDAAFLASVPDAQLQGLHQDQRVYRRVDSTERATGDPDYVNNVIAEDPVCPK